MKVNVIGEAIPQEEINEYKKYVNEKYSDKVISELTIKTDGEYVDLSCKFEDIPFDRVRRITGYLVGTLDRFNDGKRAEESQRVKHCNID